MMLDVLSAVWSGLFKQPFSNCDYSAVWFVFRDVLIRQNLSQLFRAYVAGYPSGLRDRLIVLKRKPPFSLHTVTNMISAA